MGFVTIGSYGVAYYSIGVLIPVISADTGWSFGFLAAGFSAGVLGSGGVALLAGRTFDRHGSLPVIAPTLAVGTGAFLIASWAQEPWQFVSAWAVGGASVAGGLYYNMTMPVVSRLYPQKRAAALSVLTLLGALASPIFYPVAGLMIEAWGWRGTLRGLVVLMVVCAAPGALLVRAPAAARPAEGERRTERLVDALREPTVHRVLLVFALAGAGSSALLIHQVAAFQAAGLTIAAASGFAGARGAFQIPGRLLMAPLTSRLGVRGAIALCYATAITASLALLAAMGGAAVTPLAFYYAAIGGMSLGLLSPLNGLFQAEVYGDARLGTLTGVATVIGSVSSAAGAWAAGAAVDLTGGYRATLVAVVALHGLALVALWWQRAASRRADSAGGSPGL
ncbi:MAG: MFS transporter [Chloroflexi bacterium]|nr:MFS transporter [Chloroflexota bacterium]